MDTFPPCVIFVFTSFFSSMTKLTQIMLVRLSRAILRCGPRRNFSCDASKILASFFIDRTFIRLSKAIIGHLNDIPTKKIPRLPFYYKISLVPNALSLNTVYY